MVVIAFAEQIVWEAGVATAVGVGFTVMVNVRGVPVHSVPPFRKLGVTVIVAVTGALVVLVAVNEAMLPVPLAPRPIDVLLFVHV
jgi:hypothetical protein